MSPLAEALVAAQRRSLATLEKAYVAGAIEAEPMVAAMEACGITDAVDRAFLLASLDVLKEWGVAAPTMTERVARENGEPKKATEGQVKYALDLGRTLEAQAAVPASREEVLMRPDDNGDTRREARYEWNDTDTEREHREDHRWSLGVGSEEA